MAKPNEQLQSLLLQNRVDIMGLLKPEEQGLPLQGPLPEDKPPSDEHKTGTQQGMRLGRQEESGEGSALLSKTNNHNPVSTSVGKKARDLLIPVATVTPFVPRPVS